KRENIMNIRWLALTLLGLTGIIFMVSSCDSLLNQTEESLILQSGNSPLPTITGTDYKSTDTYVKGKRLKGNATSINWGKVEPLLKQVQNQTNSRYVVLYSVHDPDQEQYNYRTSPLEFSPKAVKQADGNIQ